MLVWLLTSSKARLSNSTRDLDLAHWATGGQPEVGGIAWHRIQGAWAPVAISNRRMTEHRQSHVPDRCLACHHHHCHSRWCMAPLPLLLTWVLPHIRIDTTCPVPLTTSACPMLALHPQLQCARSSPQRSPQSGSGPGHEASLTYQC